MVSHICLSLLFLFLGFSAANADVVFFEDFNTDSADVDRTEWTTPEGASAFFGRTALRNPHIPSSMTAGLPITIAVADGAAKLRLDTYNPTDPNVNKTSFWGSEMDTRQSWQPSGGKGISFEARTRSNGIPPGVVTSMFGYHLINSSTGERNEVDFEFLSNHYNYNAPESKILINYFLNERTASAGHPELLTYGINFEEYNTFRIDWYENEMQWYVNGSLLASRAVTIPTQMDLRFNIWVPDSSFGDAYNGALLPAQSLAANNSYFYEIDWVKVSVTPEPASILLFAAGGISLGVFLALKRKKTA
jgi:hypothetical protein